MEWFNYVPGDIGTPIVFISAFIVTHYLIHVALYWQWKKVPGPIPFIPFLGNYYCPLWMTTGTNSLIDSDHRYYSDYGGKRYCGFLEFQNKFIMIGDLKILNSILMEDFEIFFTHSSTSKQNSILLQDLEWESVRKILNRVLSSSKISNLVPLMVHNSKNIMKYIFTNDIQNDSEQEVCCLFRKYSIEVVANIALGIEINSSKALKNEFTEIAVRVISSLAKIHSSNITTVNNHPKDQELAIHFKKVIEETIQKRQEKGTKRNDFLDILEDLRIKEDIIKSTEQSRRSKFDEQSLVAQSVLILASGVASVSTTLALVCRNLALHPTIQRKVLEEIDSTLKRHEGKITYEALQEMKYLDMVLKETQRMNPSIPRTSIICKKYYTLPESDVTLEPETTIVIPIKCIQNDPEYFPDPKVFKPHRFTPEKESKRSPLAFMPFGIGQRNCIGEILANLEIKTCLVEILRNVRVEVCSKTKNPLVVSRTLGDFKVSGGIYLNFTRSHALIALPMSSYADTDSAEM